MNDQRDLISPNYNQPANLPNATAVLVLGIIAIVGGLCYGVVGLICGIIAIVLANKDRKLYNSAPDFYSPSSLSTTNAGRVCAIVGLSFSLLWVLLFVFVIGFSLWSTHSGRF